LEKRVILILKDKCEIKVRFKFRVIIIRT